MKTPKRKNEGGQGLIEYALILVGVALVATLTLSIMGVGVGEVYCQIVGDLGGPVCEPDPTQADNSCDYSFDDAAALDDWSDSPSGNTYTISDGNLCIQGDGKRGREGIYNPCSSDVGSEDFTLNLNDVTTTRIPGGKSVGFGVRFRAPDEANGYQLAYNSSSNRIQFWKRVNNRWIRLAGRSTPSEWSSQNHDFQVQVEGNTFTALVDGAPVLQATDDTFSEGMVGLRNNPSSLTCIGGLTVQQKSIGD